MTGIKLHLLQSLGWALLNSLWQMALLWIVYQVISSLTRAAKASLRSSLATALLFTGFGWFVLSFILVFRDISAGNEAGSPFAATPETYSGILQGLPWISAAYLSILVFPVLRFIRNYRYVQVIRQYGHSKIQVDWRIFVRNVAAHMGIRKKVQIWVSELVSSPVTVGFLKPMILVPVAAINHLTPQQLEAVLLHELAHIRRFDYLINLLINCIQTLLYFNPFVKALVKTVEKEREKSCDELVLQFQYDSYEYASALLTLEKNSLLTSRQNGQQKTLALPITGKKNDLLSRVENIMGVQQAPSISVNKIAGLLSVIICILALNLLLLLPGNSTGKEPAIAYTGLMSPMDFAGDNDTNPDAQPETAPATIRHTLAANHTENTFAIPAPPDAPPAQPAPRPAEIASMAYRLAGFEEQQIPVLKAYQEKQVKEALAASKRVLENIQWKQVEKSIADAFSEKEKKEIKTAYEKELGKFDWNKWEDRLKLAYAQIDWDNVNSQLNNAVNQIRIDSIQQVYNDVAVKLNLMQKELLANKICSVPDTDISLKTVEERKKKVLESMRTLKAIRNKKIVSL
ncbi:MAG: M48 family metalloprotease [Sphingobacteriales bacterium]|nr:M48 family metalloprotease [Sphingobacteriales bacterium]